MDRPQTALDKPKGYFRLRESIRHRGLIEPLVITETRDSKEFELVGGGYTRLEIMDSLYRETKDPRYRKIDCAEVERPDDWQIELSHQIQNDMRGERCFIERASIIVHLVRLAEEERGGKPFEQTEAVNFLREGGYPISRSRYNQFLYAVDVLKPLIPRALASGIGRPQVEHVRKLEKVGRKIWDEFGEEDVSFDEVFSIVCKQSDDDVWHVDCVRYSLGYELAVSCDIDLQQIRWMFEIDKEELERSIQRLRERDLTGATSASPTRIRNRKPPTQAKRKTKKKYFSNVPLPARMTSDIGTQAEFHRRRRYARRVAMQLAQLSNSTSCIRSRNESPIGFEVVSTVANQNDVRSQVVMSYVGACQRLVEDTSDSIGVSTSYTKMTDRQWEYFRDLLDVSRMLNQCVTPHSSTQARDSNTPLAIAA